MQLSEFKTVLSNLSAALTGDDARLVATLSAAMPNAGTVAAFLNAAQETESEASNRGPLIADALPVLRRATPLFQTIAKLAVINDFKLLLEWAEQRPRLPIVSLAGLAAAPAAGAAQAAVRQDVVREHTELLRAARPGSKGFGEALDKLANDKRVRKQEMVAIARSVADPTLASSTKKPDALKRIRLPHDAYLDSAARSDAIGGGRRHP